MSALEKIINKAGWRWHMLGGYYTKEVLNGDDLDQAAEELTLKDARIADLVSLIKLLKEMNVDALGHGMGAWSEMSRTAALVEDALSAQEQP